MGRFVGELDMGGARSLERDGSMNIRTRQQMLSDAFASISNPNLCEIISAAENELHRRPSHKEP